MKILKLIDFRKEGVLNIFTDASVEKVNNVFSSCAGVLLVTTENGKDFIVDKNEVVYHNSTNNNGEINAIRNGIIMAIKYSNSFNKINLFSDSSISVSGLNEWVFNWVNNVNNGVLYNTSGKEVSNQSVFMDIIQLVTNANLKINIYHQKGHINYNSISSLNKAKKSMLITNKVDDIDLELIKYLSYYNDIVDKSSREKIKNYFKNNIKGKIKVFHNNTFISIDEQNMSKYKHLIKK